MTDQISVLYVDDEPDLLDLGKIFLERIGDFRVTIATGVNEALSAMEGSEFETIISDYQMPGMDGIGFLKHLRSHGNKTRLFCSPDGAGKRSQSRHTIPELISICRKEGIQVHSLQNLPIRSDMRYLTGGRKSRFWTCNNGNLK